MSISRVQNLDKREILEILLGVLEEKLKTIQDAAETAKQAATHDEAKAENKYDTRGLESAYLAGAQAARAMEMIHTIEKLRTISLSPVNLKPKSEKITLCSLVQILIDNKITKLFFILPVAGGIEIKQDEFMIQTLTPESPLGKSLLNKEVNDSFEFSIQGKIHEYEIELVI